MKDLLSLIAQAHDENWEELDLSGMGLTELPIEIGVLTGLKTLILGKEEPGEWKDGKYVPTTIANQLTTLPDELLALVSLRSLDLSGNPLCGLPEVVCKLEQLEWLNLANIGMPIIPESIAQLTNLTLLYLSGNQIAIIPESIAQLTNLTALYLYRNQIAIIPESIAQLTNLTLLYLHRNQIAIIPESIAQLTNLTKLSLDSNQIAVIPESIAQLTNLTLLNLHSNQITIIPESIAQLTNLTALYLYSNQIAIIPESIAQLTNLTNLNLSTNQITTIPESIAALTNLKELRLHYNQIKVIPDSISQLVNLTKLNFGSNQITVIPDSITMIVNLTNLWLWGNQIAIIPESIAQLTNLTELSLPTNQIAIIPESIAQLINLTVLNLRSNQIAVIPESIAQLTNLTELSLDTNQIAIIPESIAQLTNLTVLNLHSNQIAIIPESIAQLTNLTVLNLHSNQIAIIPESIAQLTNLTTLDLWNNQIIAIPNSIQLLTKLEQLDLRKNPLSIPKDILDSDFSTREEEQRPAAQPILDYYFTTRDPDETQYLHEAKLIIVGEGGAGKTSLAQKLLKPEYQLIPEAEDTSTQGIDILRWDFKGTNSNDYRIHLWDFGGQEIYHATHQFFLTERSLYLLVADSRKEDTDHPYWLNIIRLRSNNSPVLLIQNEKNNRTCNLNLRELRHEFTSLETPPPINLATDRNLPELQKEIKHQLEKLLGPGLPFPNKWLNVRNILENDSRNHIPLTDYQTLCTRNGITNEREMLALSQFLHNLGTCLHFQADLNLKQLLILKPNWGTAAVYKVLDCDRVKQNLGQFTTQDLTTIWNDQQYNNLHSQLLQLMKEFKLCYEIPKKPGRYIAPHLLAPTPPCYDWNPENNRIVRYEYKGFMPKGILTRIIVEMHKRIENVSIPNQALVWKTGVVLTHNNTRAELTENQTYRKIEIRVSGPRPRDLLTLIHDEFQDIHDSYDNLNYDTLIPCNCPTCKPSPTPHTYTLKSLQTRLEKAQYKVQCDISYDHVQVRGLIDDVFAEPDDDRDQPLDRLDREPHHYRNPYRNSPTPGKRDRSKSRNEPYAPIVNVIVNNTNQQDQTMTDTSKTNQFNGPMSGIIGSDNTQVSAPIANSIATDNAQITVNQTHNTSTEDLIKLITDLRQTALQFPTETQEELATDLEDLEAEIIKPEADRNPTRIKKRLAALVTTIGVLASGISGVADFTNTTIDLGEKLNIDVPALMGK
jgi:internalin A